MEEAFRNLSNSSRDFHVPSVVSLQPAPTALVFQRDFVSRNRPGLFSGISANWPVFVNGADARGSDDLQCLWTSAHLRERCGNCSVTVDVTPDGRFDAVIDGRFVLPHEQPMTVSAFLDHIEGTGSKSSVHGIHCIQHQNGNFTTEFPGLADEVPSHIDFASEAFGKRPDAVNLWLGADNRSYSSMHKDPYENLYFVLDGVKRFTLLPPSDAYWLDIRRFPVGQYKPTPEGDLAVVPDEKAPPVPWIDVDVTDREALRNSSNPRHRELADLLIQVDVHAGECLYLPSMWFHQVGQQCSEQSGRTLALNYWYDMDFDCKYTYFQFMNAVIEMDRSSR